MTMSNDALAASAPVQAETRSAPAPVATGRLINIDNGGTLTDICVIDGDTVYRTKTLTTPYDLSTCFFEGLKKASRVIYGKEDLQALLLSTEYIRYSTTQGTNALVERKGPRLGLILGEGISREAVFASSEAASLSRDLIGSRVEVLGAGLDEDAAAEAAVRAVNALASAGANRLVVAFGGSDHPKHEAALKRLLLRKFPPHLLGALPILYSHEVIDDQDDARRTWTALLNAFLHPAMERFLYGAEHKLREHKTRHPLLIFRNDGQSARVAKTIAIKTYSSGPRGGAEGARALADHYGFKQLLSMDVGGTTTDIGMVDNGVVRTHRRGVIEGVPTSFALCDVVSVGVGGSSIIKADAGKIVVGPESVGSAPGPACFGLGGQLATITDAFVSGGLLDPASFFGGEMTLDVERARAAIRAAVGEPLGLADEAAVQAMEAAWVAKIVGNLKHYAAIGADTTMAAFGGGGPLVVCKVAEAAGVSQVIIPGLAAVFSAFGLGFSDIGHTYEAPLNGADDAALASCRTELTERARRGMYAESAELDDCRVTASLLVAKGDDETVHGIDGQSLPRDLPKDARLSLRIEVVKPVTQPTLSGRFGGVTHAAVSHAKRRCLLDGAWQELPVYRAEEQTAGASASGPAVLEEAFYTCRIETGWRFEFNAAGDILLRRFAS